MTSFLVAVAKGTRSLVRIGDYHVFEVSQVFTVQPGFITVKALRSCRTLKDLKLLCSKYKAPRYGVVVSDGKNTELISPDDIFLFSVNKLMVSSGSCPICSHDLDESNCKRCELDWSEVTNERIGEVALEYYTGLTKSGVLHAEKPNG